MQQQRFQRGRGVVACVTRLRPPGVAAARSGEPWTGVSAATPNAATAAAAAAAPSKPPNVLKVSNAGAGCAAHDPIGLGAAGLGRGGVQAGVQALQSNVSEYAQSRGIISPSAAGALLLVSDIAGKDPRHFGTPATDLVTLLTSSMRR